MKKFLFMFLIILFAIGLISNCAYEGISGSNETDSKEDIIDSESNLEKSGSALWSFRWEYKKQKDNGNYKYGYKWVTQLDKVSIKTDREIYIRNSSNIITELQKFTHWQPFNSNEVELVNPKAASTIAYNFKNNTYVRAIYKKIPCYVLTVYSKKESPYGGPMEIKKTYNPVLNTSRTNIYTQQSIPVKSPSGYIYIYYDFDKWTITSGSAVIENANQFSTTVKNVKANTSIRAEYKVRVP